MSSEDYRETPATIRFAVNLLWAAFLSSLAKSAWLYFQMKNAIPSLPVVGNSRAIFTDTHLTIGTLVGFLFSGLICLFIFDKISDGKNWARIVVAIEFAFSFMDLIFGRLCTSQYFDVAGRAADAAGKINPVLGLADQNSRTTQERQLVLKFDVAMRIKQSAGESFQNVIPSPIFAIERMKCSYLPLLV